MTTGNGERGVVLAIALWMLVILGLLGAIALSTSSTELKIAANDRNAESAFFTAVAALTYAETDPQIYLTTGPASPRWTPPAPGTVNVGMRRTATNVSVNYLGTGLPPEGSGVDVAYFQANYFSVAATGTGPNNAGLGVEAQIAKIAPK